MDLRNSYLMGEVLNALATGMVCPTDRQMISLRHLPDEFGQPFEALRAKASDAIERTNAVLQIWLDKGRRANRFTEEYVKISRRIEGMVTTMGRGLITLHMQGEDLSKAPVSIENLLDIASFHFNKSCNGAMAAAETNPTVFERLMLNQLRWLNMLLRLERTRDRLNEKVIPGKMLPAADPKSGKLQGTGSFKAIEAAAPMNGLGAVKAMRPLVRFESLKNSDDKSAKCEKAFQKAGTDDTLKKLETESEDTSNNGSDKTEEVSLKDNERNKETINETNNDEIKETLINSEESLQNNELSADPGEYEETLKNDKEYKEETEPVSDSDGERDSLTNSESIDEPIYPIAETDWMADYDPDEEIPPDLHCYAAPFSPFGGPEEEATDVYDILRNKDYCRANPEDAAMLRSLLRDRERLLKEMGDST